MLGIWHLAGAGLKAAADGRLHPTYSIDEDTYALTCFTVGASESGGTRASISTRSLNTHATVKTRIEITTETCTYQSKTKVSTHNSFHVFVIGLSL